MAILMFIGTSILGLIGYLIMSALVKAPGSVLQSKFANLTKDSIPRSVLPHLHHAL